MSRLSYINLSTRFRHRFWLPMLRWWRRQRGYCLVCGCYINDVYQYQRVNDRWIRREVCRPCEKIMLHAQRYSMDAKKVREWRTEFNRRSFRAYHGQR
jgi:hypothetical protein